jgi:hypothetical protein
LISSWLLRSSKSNILLTPIAYLTQRHLDRGTKCREKSGKISLSIGRKDHTMQDCEKTGYHQILPLFHPVILFMYISYGVSTMFMELHILQFSLE